MKKRVLFVDDEKKVLEGIRRMLRSMRHQWEAEFAESGEQALEVLSKQTFEVIVSDMRMPGMDGAHLLAEVMERHPHMVRIVLSGHYDDREVLKSVQPAHQYLSKPCDADNLKKALERAFTVGGLLSQEGLRRLIAQIHSLPSLPSLYRDLMEELRSEGASIQRVADIISRDMAMTAKILQIVNSGFFGLPRRIRNTAQAVGLLGLETVKSLVLTIQIFAQFENRTIPSRYLEDLWHHGMRTGLFSKALSEKENPDPLQVDHAFLGGLLHDVGKLVLLGNFPEPYGEVLSSAANAGISVRTAEKVTFKATHAEVGAYLMGLWSFDEAVVRTIAFHHTPAESAGRHFDPLTAVHVADALAHDAGLSDSGEVPPEMDRQYLSELGMLDRFAQWRRICRQELEKGETGG